MEWTHRKTTHSNPNLFCSETKKMVLPSASSILLTGNNTGQVFNNPYKKAENDQIASLEKHVKMVRINFVLSQSKLELLLTLFHSWPIFYALRLDVVRRKTINLHQSSDQLERVKRTVE